MQRTHTQQTPVHSGTAYAWNVERSFRARADATPWQPNGALRVDAADRDPPGRSLRDSAVEREAGLWGSEAGALSNRAASWGFMALLVLAILTLLLASNP